MTSSIRLSLEGDEGIPLVARVYPSEMDGARPEDVHEVVVPPVGDVLVPVPPGRYVVSLLLPTGSTISKSCVVAKSEADLSFDARGRMSSALEAGESFSFQGAISEVGPSGIREIGALTIRRASVNDLHAPSAPAARTTDRSRMKRQGYGTSDRTASVQSTRLWPTVPRAAPVDAALLDGSYFRDADGWNRLGKGPSQWQGVQTSPVDALDAATSTQSGHRIVAMRVEALPPSWTRAWLRVTTSSGVEVGALPLPWTTSGGGGVVWSIDTAIVGRAAMDLAVFDGEMAGLLTYLDQGRMSLVPALLESVVTDGFMEKRISTDPSPLSVCLAAYAFLATYAPDRAEFWERWLVVLAERHPDVPDCHVVLARLRTLMRGVDRSELAVGSLKSAVETGVPFLSTGLLMLRDMLMRLPAGDNSMKRRSDLVETIARRCDPVRLFTILRFPPI